MRRLKAICPEPIVVGSSGGLPPAILICVTASGRSEGSHSINFPSPLQLLTYLLPFSRLTSHGFRTIVIMHTFSCTKGARKGNAAYCRYFLVSFVFGRCLRSYDCSNTYPRYPNTHCLGAHCYSMS